MPDEGRFIRPDCGPVDCEKHPFVSIVICTRGARPSLFECIESLLAQGCRRSEVIVVLNGPEDHGLSASLQKYPIRFLHEPRRGVCVARNRAITSMGGEIFICVDDDIIAHPLWLHELIKGFENPKVACVTGNIILEGPAYLASAKNARLKAKQEAEVCWLVDSTDSDWYQVALGAYIGSGGNMGFRKNFLEKFNSFPEHLGAGSVIGAGDESYMFYQVLKNDFAICYTPFAKVIHKQESNLVTQKNRMKQIYTGSVAFTLQMLAMEKGFRLATFKFLARALSRRLRRVLASATIASEPQELLSPREKFRAYLAGALLAWKFRGSIPRRPSS